MNLRVWYKDMGGFFGTTEKGRYTGIVIGSDIYNGMKFIVRRDDGTFDRAYINDVFKSEWVEKP